MSLAGLRWLLPSALYDAAGLAEPVRETRDARGTPPAPKACPTIVDGPVSRELDSALRPLLSTGLVRCRREDYGESTNVTGTVRYRGRNGGFLRVLRRRLTRPLLLDGIVDARHDDFVRVQTTGTDIVRSDDDVADVHRLVMVRPNGTLLIVESIGIPATDTRAPVSHEQLDELAGRLDDPRCDLDGADD